MREAAHRALADLIDAARQMLTDFEGELGCDAAYGMPVEDPEHPWHKTIMQMRAALAAIDSPDNRPTEMEVEDAIDTHEMEVGISVDRHGEAFIERDDKGGYWLSGWVYIEPDDET